MERYTLVAPCHFGMEAVLKRELTDLGYEIAAVEDGRVSFTGDVDAVCRCNVFLRSAERILLQAGRFHAVTFEDLFQNIKALPWENWIPKDGRFWVTKATSVKSKLFSPTDIQKIVKKAIVERLKEYYGISWFAETGAPYPIRVFFNKDEAVVALDTTGDSLHKRGYRKMTVKAPISETLAAGLLMLTPWKADRVLVDPFCGSGTFPIEAAMMACRMAPGMNRSFTAGQWQNLISQTCWKQTAEEANDLLIRDVSTDIQGYDIDPQAISYAKKNAQDAGVDHMIHFQVRDVSRLSHRARYGFLIANPPYGERLEEKETLPELYRTLGERFQALHDWSAFIITAYQQAEQDMGIRATKNRKLYNGMIQTYFYQFMGPKPPKRQKAPDKEQEGRI